MPGSTFQTNPIDLDKLLEDCHRGIMQLPDFQRSWVWDEDRIKSLIASISRAFPVGALMTLESGGPVNFKPRPVEGAPMEAKSASPQSLLLDGQQRMTSLYQVTLRGKRGFVQAAKFLYMLHIYRIFDLPYQSQIVPLAAILADIGDAWEHEANRAKLVRWYWNGVFGELYGSAVETRVARDFMEVPVWLKGGAEPSTVSETLFRPDRLKTMRMRLSAAYKGVNALLMKEGARDFRSGKQFDHTVFFGENVDIHHIFPQDWCKKHGLKPSVYDSIINKTPLSYRTNRIIGGVAPSGYLARLEKGDATTPSIDSKNLDGYLRSHLIDPALLRADQFDPFMEDRQKRLLALIEQATGKASYAGDVKEEGEDVELDEDTGEAELTSAAA
jgi:hypothetical protein